MAICKRALRYFVLAVLTVIIGDWVADACFLRLHDPTPIIDAQPGQFHLTSSVSNTAPAADDVLGVHISVSASTDRKAANLRAQEFLRNLVLFRDGRGMHSTPAFAHYYDWIGTKQGWKQSLLRTWFARRTGVNFDEENQAVGFTRTTYDGVPVVAQGCAICHVGKVLGKVVPGLGNKNIDPYALASTGHWDFDIHSSSANHRSSAEILAAEAAHFRDRVADDRLGNQTQGLVSVATIWNWFYGQAGEAMPPDTPRAACKVPTLWGYGAKRSAGQFCDGVGDATHEGWMAMVELVGGQRPEVVRKYLGQLKQIQGVFNELLPPAYPMAIDSQVARHGATVFARECQTCHGTYVKDRDFLPLFQTPVHVPIDEVATDDVRLKSVTPKLVELVRRNPLADIINVEPHYRPGYFAPRLEGIWARFPYLHNGSVPTVADLLKPPNERPDAFDLHDSGEVYRFDPQRLGLTVPASGSPDARRLCRLGASGQRDIYFVEREGHGNGGHEFGTALTPDEKNSLIEYLKTL